MKVEVQAYSEDKRESWEEFVEHANNGTLFHRLDFLDYHPDDRFNEHHLMFYYKGENLLGVMPLAIENEDEKTVARSPYGGSYGGIITEYDLKFRYATDIVNSLVNYLSSEGVDEIVVRPTPREQHISPSSYMEYQYHAAGFDLIDHEVTNVADLRRINKEPFEIYESNCRRAVRKAKKEGVEVVEWADDWESLYQLLSDTLDRHGKTPTHSQKELERLSEKFPDRVKLSLAYYENQPIAGVVQFLINETTNLSFYNCHDIEYRDVAPVNLLHHNEIQWSHKNGYRYFDFGTTVEGDQWSEGAMKFKESFGATGHFRNVLKLEL